MLVPIKIASLRGGSKLVQRLAARACQLQGMPEVHYGLLSAADRLSYERGAYQVLAALESLGVELLGPEELSPVLEHDRFAE
jgi:hypothetical protein